MIWHVSGRFPVVGTRVRIAGIRDAHDAVTRYTDDTAWGESLINSTSCLSQKGYLCIRARPRTMRMYRGEREAARRSETMDDRMLMEIIYDMEDADDH